MKPSVCARCFRFDTDHPVTCQIAHTNGKGELLEAVTLKCPAYVAPSKEGASE